MREPDYSILAKLRPPTPKNNHKKSYVGQKFNRLTVLSLVGHRKDRSATSYWLCQCDCGNLTIAVLYKLKKQTTKSCGCFKYQTMNALAHKHGMSGTRTFNIWCGMRSRCNNPKDMSYYIYGERGISVCERWDNFRHFLTDMGECPSDLYSIDRIDPNGNYEPSNCRWSDKITQARNTRRNRFLTTEDGQRYCLAQWAEITGLKQGLIARRIFRGRTVDEALELKER